ncbi:MAG: hypothetical protein NT092_11570 [Bacteroidia bacterium]|nr:hypothetical protein [Bacteroidia bacterium]
MIRQYLIYFTQVFKINVFASVLAAFISIPLLKKGMTIEVFIIFCITFFMTGGIILGVLFHEMFRYKEYYFYYNLGISKIRLILICYLFHIIIAIPLLLIVHYV